MRAVRSTTEYTIEFLEVWSHYPKKTGKAYAFSCWQKLKPSVELHRAMLHAIKVKLSGEWQGRESKFIMDLSRFINQKVWTDYSTEIEDGEETVIVASERQGVHICRWCEVEHEWLCKHRECNDRYMACKIAWFRLVGRHESV